MLNKARKILKLSSHCSNTERPNIFEKPGSKIKACYYPGIGRRRLKDLFRIQRFLCPTVDDQNEKQQQNK